MQPPRATRLVVRIGGKRMYLWRVVDHEGEVLDMLVQSRRDSRTALRLMRKLLKKQGFAPKLLVTDKLRSYAHLIETTARLLAPPPRHRTRPREMDNGSSATAIVGPRPLIRLGPGGDPREVPPNGGMEIKWRLQAL